MMDVCLVNPEEEDYFFGNTQSFGVFMYFPYMKTWHAIQGGPQKTGITFWRLGPL